MDLIDDINVFFFLYTWFFIVPFWRQLKLLLQKNRQFEEHKVGHPAHSPLSFCWPLQAVPGFLLAFPTTSNTWIVISDWCIQGMGGGIREEVEEIVYPTHIPNLIIHLLKLLLPKIMCLSLHIVSLMSPMAIGYCFTSHPWLEPWRLKWWLQSPQWWSNKTWK